MQGAGTPSWHPLPSRKLEGITLFSFPLEARDDVDNIKCKLAQFQQWLREWSENNNIV